MIDDGYNYEAQEAEYYSSLAEQSEENGKESTFIPEERTVKKMEEKGYPKFQWSIFVKNGKDQQFVIRADNIEEFKQAKQDVLSMIGETVVVDGIPDVQIRAAAPVSEFGKCPKCGAWNKKSSKGSIYCGNLCWKNNAQQG